ncbi:MAG: LacI family DNA-binding transcriptional regulator [Eubacteriales bacterium]|nr:LacI family DNA-binding transcriptional regulator [Eubacteriales bacterium]
MNIAEIAKMAGVSSAAVSRYFNNGYISESKRDAIREVVEKTGYRPSVQAQTLRTKKTMLVGVIIPKAASSAMGKMVEGILSVLNESGYRMLLAVTLNDPEKEVEYLRTFDQKQVDGIILAATIFTEEHRKALNDLKVPVVIVGQQVDGFACVYHDDYHAIYELTDRVLRNGHQNLGFLSATQEDKAAGAERYRGFCDAMRDHGKEDMQKAYVTAAFRFESGYEKAEELLKEYPDLDGIICATDEIAAGAQQYLKEHEEFAGRDMIVTGQGDSRLSKVTYPTIPTIHYYYYESGRQAVQILMTELNGKEDDKAVIQREIKLGYEIVTHGINI